MKYGYLYINSTHQELHVDACRKIWTYTAKNPQSNPVWHYIPHKMHMLVHYFHTARITRGCMWKSLNIDSKKSTVKSHVTLHSTGNTHACTLFSHSKNNILINNLNLYAIIGTPLKLLDNYLRNRHQFVTFTNINSELQEIQTGIPQGAILGPLLFSIYINDPIKSSNIFNYLISADNTTLYFIKKTLTL